VRNSQLQGELEESHNDLFFICYLASFHTLESSRADSFFFCGGGGGKIGNGLFPGHQV